MKLAIAAPAALALLALMLSMQGSAVPSGNEITLTGEFHWTHMNHTGDLEGVFTNSGDKIWSVEFRFEWDGERHVYAGTAEGSLTDGELRGSVVTDNPDWPRTFLFAGRFEGGRFTGTHTAIQVSGGTHPTGTLALGRDTGSP